MIVTCERCGRRTAKPYKCNYCGRVICEHCLKSQKRVKDRSILKIYICKDCWTKIELRKMFKNNTPLILP